MQQFGQENLEKQERETPPTPLLPFTLQKKRGKRKLLVFTPGTADHLFNKVLFFLYNTGFLGK